MVRPAPKCWLGAPHNLCDAVLCPAWKPAWKPGMLGHAHDRHVWPPAALIHSDEPHMRSGPNAEVCLAACACHPFHSMAAWQAKGRLAGSLPHHPWVHAEGLQLRGPSRQCDTGPTSPPVAVQDDM